jgi:membrane protease YdiL (CAAX protease family)
LFFALGGKWNTSTSAIIGSVIMIMPALGTIIVQKFIYQEPLKPLGISFKINRWWLVAWLLPPLIAFATIGISLFIPEISFSMEMTGFFERFEGIIPLEQLQQMKDQMIASPIHIFWIVLIQGLVAGITINALFGFGEELGWRGFLFKELSYMSFWKSSTIIGFIWGVWHAPLILQGHNYPQHPVAGVFMMILWCILLSPIFSYIRLRSKSVIAAAIMHGTLNGTAGLAIMMIEGGNDLIIGVTGVAGFIVLLIVNLFIFFFDRSLRERPLNIIMEEIK